MFSRTTLQSIAFLLVLSALFGQGLLALLCVLLLLTAGLARLWDRWSLARISYERTLSHQRAFPGDEVELAIRIANRKLLPLARLEVLDLIPQGLEVLDHTMLHDPEGRTLLERSTSLRWYEALTWRYRLRCHERGVYRLGPAQLTAGDPFGFYRTEYTVSQRTSLVVYPRLLSLEELGLPPRHPLGELRARHLIHDPLRTVGVRDYHPDDPLKSVHWSATARTGSLQTRIYESTTSREVALFLDLDSFEHYWEGIDEQLVERAISAAATVANACIADGYAVGFYANGAPVEHEQLPYLAPSRSPAQLALIMETLARLTAVSVTPMARLLQIADGTLSSGATVLLVSSIKPAATRAALMRLRERGYQVVWLYVADDAPPTAPGVIVYHAPSQIEWRAQQAESYAR
jgi:uncharacterized protein (DUF58 family)